MSSGFKRGRFRLSRSVTLHTEMWAALERAARAEGTSVSGVIERSVLQALNDPKLTESIDRWNSAIIKEAGDE